MRFSEEHPCRRRVCCSDVSSGEDGVYGDCVLAVCGSGCRFGGQSACWSQYRERLRWHVPAVALPPSDPGLTLRCRLLHLGRCAGPVWSRRPAAASSVLYTCACLPLMVCQLKFIVKALKCDRKGFHVMDGLTIGPKLACCCHVKSGSTIAVAVWMRYADSREQNCAAVLPILKFEKVWRKEGGTCHGT